MNWKEHIVTDKEILLGKPILKGTRISVEYVIGLLAQGWNKSTIIENYPMITKDSLQSVFSYLQDCFQDGLLFPSVKVNT